MPSIFDIFDKNENNDKTVVSIPVDRIEASRYQPRLHFDETALDELCNSIQQNGLIQPITVRKVDDHYEIIAGERRFRACKKAGFQEVDCYILSPNEDEAAQMALVENVQREDLSAIEEARSYVQIMRQANLTQQQVADKIGKSQSTVANKIRLLNLPDEIQDAVVDGKITERHARALLTLPQKDWKKAYHYIEKNNLNVKQSEVYIEKLKQPKQTKKKSHIRGFSKNVRIGINSVNQCVQMIQKMGIQVKLDSEETDDEVKLTIHFPKM